MTDAAVSPASISITRPLEWIDTDAAGIWHWSTAFRHIEGAELEMHQRIGIMEHTFGWLPRANVDLDFRTPVTWGEQLTTTVTVEKVGRSSIVYRATIASGERPVADGTLTVVMIGEDRRPREVPDVVRGPLLTAGDVS